MKIKVSRIETEIVGLISDAGGLYLRDAESSTGFSYSINTDGTITPNHVQVEFPNELDNEGKLKNRPLTPIYRGDEIRITFT